MCYFDMFEFVPTRIYSLKGSAFPGCINEDLLFCVCIADIFFRMAVIEVGTGVCTVCVKIGLQLET